MHRRAAAPEARGGSNLASDADESVPGTGIPGSLRERSLAGRATLQSGRGGAMWPASELASHGLRSAYTI